MCSASSAELTGTVLANSGKRERLDTDAEDFQIVTATGTMRETLALGSYVVCHSYRPLIVWDIFFTLVP